VIPKFDNEDPSRKQVRQLSEDPRESMSKILNEDDSVTRPYKDNDDPMFNVFRIEIADAS
jgi:hypothetical protein